MGSDIRTIVVGVAQPGIPDQALACSMQIARRTGARLCVVHAYPAAPAFPASARRDFNWQWVHGGGSRAQELLREHVRRHGSDDGVAISAVPGRSADVIQRAAVERGADLVVVGATRSGSLRSAMLGTTAHRVLHGTSAPLLLARKPLPMDAPARAILTTDLSLQSGRVYDRALDLLPQLLGRMPELRSLYVTGRDIELAGSIPDFDRLVRSELETFLTEHGRPGLEQGGSIRMGFPEREIIRESRSWEADLVVLGSHSRHGLARLVLGSVAEGVLQRLSASVLVLPACASRHWSDEAPTNRVASLLH